jgi:hypothetical protein
MLQIGLNLRYLYYNLDQDLALVLSFNFLATDNKESAVWIAGPRYQGALIIGQRTPRCDIYPSSIKEKCDDTNQIGFRLKQILDTIL